MSTIQEEAQIVSNTKIKCDVVKDKNALLQHKQLLNMLVYKVQRLVHKVHPLKNPNIPQFLNPLMNNANNLEGETKIFQSQNHLSKF